MMLKYVIPADGDEMDHPNVFYLSKPSSQSQNNLDDNDDSFSLFDIKNQFPLPGLYQFRFKKKLSESKTVWLDIDEDDAVVPKFEGTIQAKVTRLCLHPEELQTFLINNSKNQEESVSQSKIDFTPTGAGKRVNDINDLPIESQTTFQSSSSNFQNARHQKSDSTEDPFGLFSSGMNSPNKPSRGSSNSNVNSKESNQQHRDSDLLNFDFTSTGTTGTTTNKNSNQGNSFEDWSF